MKHEFEVSNFLRSHLEVPGVGLGLADSSPSYKRKAFLPRLPRWEPS